MIRIGSQLLYCAPGDIRRMHAIELSDEKIVTKIIDLQKQTVESANTLFFDGIITASPVSLKQRNINTKQLSENWLYADLSKESMFDFTNISKPVILDFGSSDVSDISQIIREKHYLLEKFSIFEIFDACIYNPAKITGLNKTITTELHEVPVIWQNLDLVGKTLTKKTNIRTIDGLGNK